MYLRKLRRPVLVAAACLAGIVVCVGTAVAGVGDPVNCEQDPTSPECTVVVILPGKPGNGGGDGGAADCHFPDGGVAPCAIEGRGYLGADGCYYNPWSGGPTGPHGEPPPMPGPGAWYFRSCTAPWGDDGEWWVWLPDGPGITPQQLAQQAVNKLRLPAPLLRLNPSPPLPQLVFLPTWMWADSSTWGPRSATATVPGLSVTATATPTSMTIATGDGDAVACAGPGTVWTAGTDPAAASPTCGHTYARPGSYTLTATVTWTVTWAGGGASGTVPALTTTATVSVPVTESQALNHH